VSDGGNQELFRDSVDHLVFGREDQGAVATSKVLNEGVNIPDASVAIVLSGSGSSREHIQRLGRILRKQPEKEAILYEVVAAGTTEEGISRRRGNAEQFQESRIKNKESEWHAR
jgi:superfamily II DNA or RNA helicase